jgi:predicted amidohydrolase
MTAVAAVQMRAVTGNIAANLANAENWVHHAIERGARWVVLPEFFASGMAYHPEKMLDAIEPIDGKTTQMLKKTAKQGNAFVGGTFLVQSGADVYNTFVLASPDGRVFTHDKDFPSGFVEHAFYAGGEDEEFVKILKRAGIPTLSQKIPARKENIKSGIFPVSDELAVGAAICWEQLRYRTARRLRGKVDLVLAASCWGTIDAEVGITGVRTDMLKKWEVATKELILKAPRRLARLVGAPVVHANLVGDKWSQDARDGEPSMLIRTLGDSQIVDSNGSTLASRSYSEGEGVVIAEVQLGRVQPVEEIPISDFWTPDFTESSKDSWHNDGAAGRDYYLNTARPLRNRD